MKSWAVLIVAGLLLVTLLVRLYRLDGQGLECDELFTVSAANGQHYVYFPSRSGLMPHDFPTTVEGYGQLLTPRADAGLGDVTGVLRRNVHMPLYFYLMHYWVKWAGTSEWALRLPSALFGTLAVLMTFLLGKEMFNSFVGLVAALLLALLPVQVYHSQQARMYSLLVLLAAAAAYTLNRALQRPSSVRHYVLYGVVSAAGLYTHYVYVFFVAAQALFVLFVSPAAKQHRRRWFFTFLAVAAALLPWLLAVSAEQQQASADVTAWARGDVPAGVLLTRTAFAVMSLVSAPGASLGWLAAAVACGFLLSGVVALRHNGQALRLLCLWVVLPAAGIVAVNFLLDANAVAMMRYWMLITPALYLLVALGVEWLCSRGGARGWRVAAVVMLAVLCGWGAVATARGTLLPKPDRYGELAQFVRENVNDPANELIMTEGMDAIPLAVAYYEQGAARNTLHVLAFNWAVDPVNKQRLRQVMLPRTDVWLLMTGRSKAGSMLVNSGYFQVGKPARFGHVMAFHYRRRAAPQGP